MVSTRGSGSAVGAIMHFNHFLSAYYPDPSYGGDRLYADMIEQAKLVDRLGYRGVTIPEHHLINILLVPDPLQMAVKVASVTRRIEIITSVCVLPLHDMRTFAGASIQADILCEGRLILGIGISPDQPGIHAELTILTSKACARRFPRGWPGQARPRRK